MRKSYRVKSEKDFQDVFFNGKSCANKHFVCYTLKKEKNKHFRVGLSVGKKIGNVVARNAMKRKMRESLKDLKPNIIDHVDFILIARVSANLLTTKEVKQNIEHVLKVAKITRQGE